MNASEDLFDWVQFPEGRARFSGGGRSWDDLVHDTFSVEVDGREYFGEIKSAFLPNNNDYNVEVVSFGYRSNTAVGMPMLGSCQAFTMTQVRTIEALIVQLIGTGMHFEDRPPILMEFPHAHFMGKVSFLDGWALVKDEARAMSDDYAKQIEQIKKATSLES